MHRNMVARAPKNVPGNKHHAIVVFDINPMRVHAAACSHAEHALNSLGDPDRLLQWGTGKGARVLKAVSKHEKSGKTTSRHWDMNTELITHQQLGLPELSGFFATVLGNLPLSVTLCGTIMRLGPSAGGEGGGGRGSGAGAGTGAGSITEFIRLFKEVQIETVDARGVNLENETHYLGLVGSVLVTIERLLTSSALADDAEKDDVRWLLACLSMLPHTSVPTRLLAAEDSTTAADATGTGTETSNPFTGSTTAGTLDDARILPANSGALSTANDRETWLNSGHDGSDIDTSGEHTALASSSSEGTSGTGHVFRSTVALRHAEAMLRNCGLVRGSSDTIVGSDVVGTMHQMVARCDREQFVRTHRGEPVAATAVASLRQELVRQVDEFASDTLGGAGTILGRNPASDALVECATHFHGLTPPPRRHHCMGKRGGAATCSVCRYPGHGVWVPAQHDGCSAGAGPCPRCRIPAQQQVRRRTGVCRTGG